MKFLSYLLLSLGITLSAYASSIEEMSFSDNPGELKMFFYASQKASKKAPLVILLHGCGQDAASFAKDSGWLKLAQDNGFHLILPQQIKRNNDYQCFNWFEKKDALRNEGESASILSMLETFKEQYAYDTKKVYVTGLSAGGVMANNLLANYPDIFKAGAIASGVAYGCGFDLLTAWQCMKGFRFPRYTREASGEAVFDAIGHQGSFPRVIVFHGQEDSVVKFSNGTSVVDQWTYVHHLSTSPTKEEQFNSYKVSEYSKGKEVMVKMISAKNLDHGYPVNPSSGCGQAAAYVLNSDICAAKESVQFFGILK